MTDVDELVRCITALLALNERNVLVPHGVPGLARDCLKSAAAALERMKGERDEARSRFNDIDLCKMGQAPCASLLAAEAEVARLREALTELLELSLNPAGMTPEIVSDDGKFANFIAENERKCEAAIVNARRALAQRSE